MDKKSVSSKSETNQDVDYKEIAWGGSTNGRGGADSLTDSHKQGSVIGTGQLYLTNLFT